MTNSEPERFYSFTDDDKRVVLLVLGRGERDACKRRDRFLQTPAHVMVDGESRRVVVSSKPTSTDEIPEAMLSMADDMRQRCHVVIITLAVKH